MNFYIILYIRNTENIDWTYILLYERPLTIIFITHLNLKYLFLRIYILFARDGIRRLSTKYTPIRNVKRKIYIFNICMKIFII